MTGAGADAEPDANANADSDSNADSSADSGIAEQGSLVGDMGGGRRAAGGPMLDHTAPTVMAARDLDHPYEWRWIRRRRRPCWAAEAFPHHASP